MQEDKITKAVLDALAEVDGWCRDKITLEAPLIEFSLDSLDNRELILKIEANLDNVTTSKYIEEIFEDENKTVVDLIVAVRREFPQFDNLYDGGIGEGLTGKRQKHNLSKSSFGMDSLNRGREARFHFKRFPVLGF